MFVVAVVKIIDFELGAVVVARTVWWVVVVKTVAMKHSLFIDFVLHLHIEEPPHKFCQKKNKNWIKLNRLFRKICF